MVSETERIAWRLIVRTIILIAGMVALVFLGIQLRGVLVLLLISAVLSTSINPLAVRVNSWTLPFRNWRIPKVLTVLLLYVGLVLLVALGGLFLIPPLLQQGQGLLDAIPRLLDQITRIQQDVEAQFPMLPKIRLTIDDLQPLLAGLFQDPSQVLGLAFSLVDLITNAVIVATLIVYFVMFGDSTVEFIVSFLPKDYRDRARMTAAEIGNRLGSWLGGQLLVCFVIFSGVLIALLILGIPFPVVLALIAGTAELIPFMGPVIGFIPSAIVAAFVSPYALIAVVVFYIALQWVESNVLSPMIMSRVMHMPPIVVLLGLIIGGVLLGLAGALIAVPVTAAIVVIFTTLRTASLMVSPTLIVPPTAPPTAHAENEIGPPR